MEIDRQTETNRQTETDRGIYFLSTAIKLFPCNFYLMFFPSQHTYVFPL